MAIPPDRHQQTHAHEFVQMRSIAQERVVVIHGDAILLHHRGFRATQCLRGTGGREYYQGQADYGGASSVHFPASVVSSSMLKESAWLEASGSSLWTAVGPGGTGPRTIHSDGPVFTSSSRAYCAICCTDRRCFKCGVK
jgi:hypothetical protein